MAAEEQLVTQLLATMEAQLVKEVLATMADLQVSCGIFPTAMMTSRHCHQWNSVAKKRCSSEDLTASFFLTHLLATRPRSVALRPHYGPRRPRESCQVLATMADLHVWESAGSAGLGSAGLVFLSHLLASLATLRLFLCHLLASLATSLRGPRESCRGCGRMCGTRIDFTTQR